MGCKYYLGGDGIIPNYKKALNWYMQAAEQGHVLAQHSAGTMYYRGQGIPHNNEEAVKWFARAAEQGYAPAQCDLGDIYLGVPRNYEEALKWLAKATERGNTDAKQLLKTLKTSIKIIVTTIIAFFLFIGLGVAMIVTTPSMALCGSIIIAMGLATVGFCTYLIVSGKI